MIIIDSEKSDSSARSGSSRRHTSYGPVDDPPSPPPYSPTIPSSDDHSQDRNHTSHASSFHSTSSTRLDLPPRCNYLIERKTIGSLSGTWHVDTALGIPERLLPAITEFDGRWNRETQRARKSQLQELQRRPGRFSGSSRGQHHQFIETRPNLILGTTNGAISGDIHIVSSDGLVGPTILVAEGCNGPINLRIHVAPNLLLRVFASSINGTVNIKIPSSFEGAVVMSTSRGAVNISDTIKPKLTTFSSNSNKLCGFVGDWRAQGFGNTSNSTNPDDDPPLQGPQDPFAAWTGSLIDLSSTNGAVSLTYVEEDLTTAYVDPFKRAMQGFMDSWFSGGRQDGRMNDGSPVPAPPMFNPPYPPVFNSPHPPVFHPSPPAMFHPGLGALDLD
ncbi:unnamed protein product [Rhizoctonia solani]|uniref:DUF7330 domain-containing protein n=3 Tax=Rhizoctonia solani TaxID=456999 RepID=A0A8H2XUP2_9AGAM|nr:hypothetical protein RSOL_086250 [Rhizoctonia solani AG-3 Rhs1AP]KEP47151.1 hypothetical protein V565_166250 [Rhizoctonia solani 123E]CAE6434020.1 unnamed protein product [Rhizoctonia solani]